MNLNKAREFYSAYLEGTLDAGLKEQFERALNNPEIRQDYDEFRHVLQSLEATRDEEIEVPMDLSRRITERLEANAPAAKPGKVFHLFPSKPVWAGLAAGILLLTAFFSLNNRGGGVSVAGTTNAITPRADVLWDGEQATLRYQMPEEDQLVVRDGVGGEQVEAIEIGTNPINRPLTNPNPTARVIELDLQKGSLDHVIVIPGTNEPAANAGEGSALDLAVALSETYNIALEVTNPASEKVFKWDLKPGSAVTEVASNLREQGVSLSENKSGVYTLNLNR